MRKRKLENKVCVVTGGARNIGYATVKKCLDEGATVVIVDTQQVAIDEALSTLEAPANGVLPIACDVSIESSVSMAVGQIVERHGRIDAWINNAGVCTLNMASGLSVEEWDRVLAVNLRGPWLCAKHALPHMPEGASIVNLTSQAAHRPQRFTAHYSSSKAGLLALTRALAIEFAPSIRVNAVSPGVISTNMIDNEINWRVERGYDMDRDAVLRKWLETMPLGRFQDAEDIANAIIFLASDDARQITGEVINVSGGAVMW